MMPAIFFVIQYYFTLANTITMVADDLFYNKFRDWIIGAPEVGDEKEGGIEEAGADGEGDNAEEAGAVGEGDNAEGGMNIEEKEQKSSRVAFFLHQMDIIPDDVRDLYNNMLRAFPSSPIFLLLGVGAIGTNIGRYSAVRRKSAHETNVIRTGCFYKFLAPSRFGKGIAMGLIQKLGKHVEEMRCEEHMKYVASKERAAGNDDGEGLKAIQSKCKVERPKLVFLTGANVLQTQATAASNAGCGIIMVNEIKSGKIRYTDADGSYGSILDFADPDVSARSYRKAEFIPQIKKCRIQLIAAGVKED